MKLTFILYNSTECIYQVRLRVDSNLRIEKLSQVMGAKATFLEELHRLSRGADAASLEELQPLIWRNCSHVSVSNGNKARP